MLIGKTKGKDYVGPSRTFLFKEFIPEIEKLAITDKPKKGKIKNMKLIITEEFEE